LFGKRREAVEAATVAEAEEVLTEILEEASFPRIV